jgi:hypothetical protein
MGKVLWYWIFKETFSKSGFVDSKKITDDSVKKLEKNKKAPLGA